jgi:hypothetical protein
MAHISSILAGVFHQVDCNISEKDCRLLGTADKLLHTSIGNTQKSVLYDEFIDGDD